MSEIRLRKIGVEKSKIFQKNFDVVYDWWKNHAVEKWRYDGDLTLIKERGKVLIYIPMPQIPDRDLEDLDY